MPLILQSNKIIVQKLSDALLGRVRRRLDAAKGQIKKEVQNLIRQYITDQPHWKSLLGDKLQGHFGIPAGEEHERLDEILNTILGTVKVSRSATRRGPGAQVVLSVSAIDNEYATLYNLPAANVITEKGENLPWLYWLLEAGDQGVINDYDVMGVHDGIAPTSSRPRASLGRSGLAIMIKVGRSWGVPTEFASRGEQNFLTDAVDQLIGSNRLEQILVNKLQGI